MSRGHLVSGSVTATEALSRRLKLGQLALEMLERALLAPMQKCPVAAE